LLMRYYFLTLSEYLQQAPIENILRGPFVGSEFPVFLDCGDHSWPSVELPEWAKETFQSPFEWVHCDFPAGSPLDLHICYEKAIPAYDPLSSFFETTILPNGTLIIHQRTLVPWRPIGILCVSRIMAKKVFAAYFQNDNGRSVSFQYIPGDYGADLIVPKSLQSVSKDYRAGQYAKGTIELTALYTANPLKTKTAWTKNGGPLPILFETTDHSLIFPEEITPADSGNYSLTVTGPSQREVFTFNVLVNAPPKIRRMAPRSVYVLEGQPVQIETEFEGRLTSRSVSINGILIDTLSTALFEESLKHLRDQFPYIDGLYPDIEFPSDTSIRYTLRDITSSANAPYGASHSVTLTGTNTLGSVHTQTVIRVLSLPRITRLMADSSCEDDCFNGTSHRFLCDVDLAPYAGLNVVKTWEFDGRDLEALHQQDPLLTFLKIARNEVILSIVAGNATFDRLFASAELSCRFRIYAPEEEELFGVNAMEPLYDTKTDPELHKLLTAAIRKNPSGNTSIASFTSLSWIAAVVIAVMILLAVIILAVCVVMRNKGRTYLRECIEPARSGVYSHCLVIVSIGEVCCRA
uniref:REJ domain-containing protein n=1 Tax=Schistocephalus solidus TaxID=70667 RepID=A0A183T8D5_SCHSO